MKIKNGYRHLREKPKQSMISDSIKTEKSNGKCMQTNSDMYDL